MSSALTLNKSAPRWHFIKRGIGTLLGFVCLLSGNALSQTFTPHKVMGRYQQFIWQEQHGLPQNTVQAITRTSDGYLWLGTLAGAARFDGAHFTVFDNGNTAAIKGSYITALLEDRQGALWMTADVGGLVRYRDGQFRLFTARDGLPDETTKALLEDREGNLWIGAEGGLARFKDDRFTVYTTREGLPGGLISAIVEDPEGGLWIGTGSGLARFKENRFTVYTTREGLAHDYVRSLCRDRSGTLWVGTENGLSRFQNHRLSSAGLPEALRHVPVPALYQDREGYLWVGTLGNGLFRGKGDRFERYTTKEGLPGDRVVAIFQEPEGDLWVGTNAGLSQLRDGLCQTYTAQDGLRPDFVSAIYEDRAGTMWLGTTNGLNRFKDGQFTAYMAKDGMPAKFIRTICEDRAGALWIGTNEGGVMRFEDGRFTIFTTKDGLTGNQVNAVCADREGNLWIGSRGLNRFRDGRFTLYTTADGLADNDVRQLFEDRAGNLWIGTQSGGLSRFKDGQVTTWTSQDGLPSKPIVSFFEDHAGGLWMGTVDGGLSRFKDGRFANVTAKDGLYDNVAFQMLADADDDTANLWMSCNRGIYRVSLKELNDFAEGRRRSVTSFVYGVGDGMFSRECNSASPAGWRSRDGLLWFPTTKGLVKIDPRRLNREPPLLAIERVILDREAQPAGQLVQIRPGQENLEIAYTGLSWSRPQQIRFRYQLVGLDHEWIDAGTRRTAYYPHLPPGEYTFKVIADNGEGVWNTEGVSLRVKVLPPFYQTGWFMALMAVAGLGLGTMIYQVRVRQLTRARAAQEAFSRQLIASQEQERKRIAAELHDSLGQSLVIIRNWALLGASQLAPQAPAREELDEINTTASQAITEVREIAYNLGPYHLDRLGLAGIIQDMVNRVAQASGIRFTTELDPLNGALSRETEMNLYRIAQETINNLVKHAEASEAAVRLKHEAGKVKLTVVDNGKGFDPHLTRAAGRGGFGLTGMAERVRLLSGAWEIHSAPGQGTRIEISIGDEQAK